MELIGYLISLISGGVIFELFRLLYPDLKKLYARKVEAKNVLIKHSDSILKNADELFGKIHSLAADDFQVFTKYDQEKDEMDKIYILYLIASFWASLGILKQESSFIHLARIQRGQRLLSFVNAYEAKSNRIIDRSFQRAIGEAVIIHSNSGYTIMTLYDFTDKYKDEKSHLRRTIEPLEISLFHTKEKKQKQRFLIFGIIVLALIDMLDRRHKVVRERKVYVNKLSRKSRSELKYRVFGHYLPFIKKSHIYYME